jgi:E3 ubiquitin-protein ligase HUWE1
VELATANKLLRQLITLHIRINLLAEIYANAGYSQGRSANTILQVISGRDGLDIITDLGHVHRALVWETILLKAVLTAKGVNVPGSSSPGGLLRADESQEEVSGEGAPSSTAKVDDKKEPEQAEKAGRDQNAKALKYLASRLSTAPTPFFQGELVVYSLALFCS